MTSAPSLAASFFLDSDHPEISKYAHFHTTGCNSVAEKVIKLYHQIRDEFDYSPYQVDLRREALVASQLLGQTHGNCVQKAMLLVACLRQLKNSCASAIFYRKKSYWHRPV